MSFEEDVSPSGLHPADPSSTRSTHQAGVTLRENEAPRGGLRDLRLSDERRELRQFKRERDRRVDLVRAMIGLLLLVMLAFAIVAPWISVWVDADFFDEVKELFPLVTTPLIGLIGAAMGFYFGERSGPDRGGDA
jgi:hypothetical protein